MKLRLLTIAVMLRSIGDGLRGPTCSRWHAEQKGGMAATRWLVCPRCKGDGRIRWKQKTVDCDHVLCRGAGGWHVDPYDNTKVAVATLESDRVAAAVRIKCLECSGEGEYPNGKACKLCKGAGELVLWAPEADGDPGGSGEKRSPSQPVAELLAALAELHVLHPGRHFAVCYSFMLGLEEPDRLAQPMRWMAVQGMRDLGELLPRRWSGSPGARARAVELAAEHREALRRARGTGRWADAAAREARDREIRRLAGRGRSVRQISKVMGVGKSTVMDILGRAKEAA